MSNGPKDPASSRFQGVHVATLAHEGHLWDAYLEFEDDPHRPHLHRGRLRFDPADSVPGMAARTTVIIIETSHEEALAKARAFDEHQLQGLLRSCLPDDVQA